MDFPKDQQGVSVGFPRDLQATFLATTDRPFDSFGLHIRQRAYDETICPSIGIARESTSDATSSRSCVLPRVSQEEAQVLPHVSMFELRVAGARVSSA
jgi:hypothetical protein